MTLLEAAKAALEALKDEKEAIGHWGAYASDYFKTKWDLGGDIEKAEQAEAELRDAIAEEEADKDGAHSCGYHCQRPACAIAQRDELRAKLAALEAASGEPEAWTTLAAGRRFMTPDEHERDNWAVLGLAITPLYTHPAPLPAYEPMTDEELWETYDKGLTPNDSATTALRAIEQAVLAKLGWGHD